MGVFDRQIALANRMITANGEICTWKQAAAPVVADQTKPWIATNGAPTEFEVLLLFLSRSSSPLARLFGNANIEVGKLKALMPATSFVPSLADTVVRSGAVSLQLDSIEPLSPNGQVILWWVGFKL